MGFSVGIERRTTWSQDLVLYKFISCINLFYFMLVFFVYLNSSPKASICPLGWCERMNCTEIKVYIESEIVRDTFEQYFNFVYFFYRKIKKQSKLSAT